MKLEEAQQYMEVLEEATYVDRDLSYLDARKAAFKLNKSKENQDKVIYGDRTGLWYIVRDFPGLSFGDFLNTHNEAEAVRLYHDTKEQH